MDPGSVGSIPLPGRRPTTDDMTEFLFPYMFWAREKALRTPHGLSRSGMPTASAELLQLPADPEADLDAPLEWLPRVEAQIARHVGVEPERVIVTGGATGALHLAASVCFPESHVVTETPSYNPFRALAELYARSQTPIERRPEEGWALAPDAVSRALYARRPPAHLFVCNPHNPTGALADPESLLELAQLASGTDGLLISNETYMEFAPPEKRYYAARLAPNAISLGSLTKAYGLGPLRIGWLVLGEGVARERKHFLDRQYLVSVDNPTSSLRAGLHALKRLQVFEERLHRVERESKPVFREWLDNEERVHGRVPPYGISAFVAIENVRDTHALSEHLALQHAVDVVPGEFFGAGGYLRIGFGVEADVLRQGLRNLSEGLTSFAQS